MTDDTSKSAREELTYEETPIIDTSTGSQIPAESAARQNPVRQDLTPEAARVFGGSDKDTSTHTPQPAQGEPHIVAPAGRKGRSCVGTILFIAILFGLGIWLSGEIRTLMVPDMPVEQVPADAAPEISVSDEFEISTPSAAPSVVQRDPAGDTQETMTYEILSGATGKPIPGLTYELPASVKAPVCDSASCSSRGTNLPGGTRFTVAPRGTGQLLPDFRGAILTDAAGREFTMKTTNVGQIPVYEYSGTFTGRTGGGYTFTRMRGVLIAVTDTMSVEFNHFSPSGSSSDFAADEAVFEKIVTSFRSSGTQ